MNIEQIALIILAGSFLGMMIIIYRKIPVLVGLPRTAGKPLWKSFISKAKVLVKNTPILRSVSLEVFLQKLLSKIRVLTLKTDNKTSNWLKRLRTKAKIRKNLDASYWEEIKKIKK